MQEKKKTVEHADFSIIVWLYLFSIQFLGPIRQYRNFGHQREPRSAKKYALRGVPVPPNFGAP
jgi:hypothetical protein